MTEQCILVTGGAGFIGSNLVDSLLIQGHKVIVVDNFDPFYDINLKKENIKAHLDNDRYQLIEVDIRDAEALTSSLSGQMIDTIVHIAAKAGVRPSIKDPVAYQEVNVTGTQNLLELAKNMDVKQFVFASSSSVYGINPNVPWKESDYVLQPISPYASTKVSGELLGHVYSHLYGIRFLALRFFTVFGPRQRPDLAINKFVRKILAGDEIPVFGDGSTKRDYTFVHDIVQGIEAAIRYDASPFEVINLGAGRTISLAEMIAHIEDVFNTPAKIDRQPMQPGDVPLTYADISKARELLNYEPKTSFVEGLRSFQSWMDAPSTVQLL